MLGRIKNHFMVIVQNFTQLSSLKGFNEQVMHKKMWNTQVLIIIAPMLFLLYSNSITNIKVVK